MRYALCLQGKTMKIAPSNMPRVRCTHIYMLPPADVRPGLCSVCGGPALIRLRDVSTDARLGMCCLRPMLEAERLLGSVIGLRHPVPGETPNH